MNMTQKQTKQFEDTIPNLVGSPQKDTKKNQPNRSKKMLG